MGKVEITRREILIGIVIALIMITIGLFISTKIHDSTTVSNDKYFKALKIDNNPEMFDYAIETNVGNILSHGRIYAVNPVSSSMIDGEYFSIRRVEEHYVMKTRTVTYTNSDGDIKTRTETYWEWDEVGREYQHADSFIFLDREFSRGIINLNNYEYTETVKKKTFSDVRFKFYTMPKEFDALIFSTTDSGTIKNNELYYGSTISGFIDRKESEADVSVTLFWVFWIVLTIGAVFGFTVLENRFLNNYR